MGALRLGLSESFAARGPGPVMARAESALCLLYRHIEERGLAGLPMRLAATLSALVMLAGCVDALPPSPGIHHDEPPQGAMQVTSPDYGFGEAMDGRHSCHGAGEAPTWQLSGVPEEAVSLLVVFDDPDAKRGTFVHWLLWDLDPATATLGGAGADQMDATYGATSEGGIGFVPLCPSSGTHRYFLSVFALDVALDLPSGSGVRAVADAMDGHVLAETWIKGTYSA